MKSDSPILNLNNNKLIGITESYFMFKKHYYKRGTYLIYPIKDFIQKYYHMNQNKKDNFNIKDNLSKEEIIIEKYNSIKSLLTKKVFENLNKLVSYNNINIKAAPSSSPFCLETEEALDEFSLKNIENIVEQIKGYYKIKIGSEIINGFICKIPILNKNKYLKVLITSNSNINEEILNKKDGKISIEINGEKIKYICLNNIMKYTSKAYDTTILEIKEEAEINNYLEIDEYIFNGDINHSSIKLEFKYRTIYSIYSIIYQYGKLSTLYGMIQNQDNNLFYHSIGVGSPGSPIFNKKNKLIGMHIGMHSNRNIGQCLYYPIKEFIEKNFLEK
jgi:flagellar hook protein FlgE